MSQRKLGANYNYQLQILFLTLLIAIIFTFCTSKINSETIKIESLPSVNSIDTLKETNEYQLSKADHFVIHGFKRSDDMFEFVKKYADSIKFENPRNYFYYSITFYKYSEFTNNEHLIKNPRDIDRYSMQNDLVYSFQWENGVLRFVNEFKNGQIINNTSQVTVE